VFFDTFEDAQNSLIESARLNVLACQRDLDMAKLDLDNRFDLKNPYSTDTEKAEKEPA
jgi:hypothetical protein